MHALHASARVFTGSRGAVLELQGRARHAPVRITVLWAHTAVALQARAPRTRTGARRFTITPPPPGTDEGKKATYSRPQLIEALALQLNPGCTSYTFKKQFRCARPLGCQAKAPRAGAPVGTCGPRPP